MSEALGVPRQKRTRVSANKRKHAVLSLLEERGFVTVSELSKHFGISEVSIRKLLISMEGEYLLRRIWGGAVKSIGTTKELAYPAREAQRLSEKVSIARLACSYISEGDSIYVDSGTTTLELVKELAQSHLANILLATNALDHASEMIGQPNVNILLVGGELRHNARSCSGYLTKDTISQMVFDKCFVGIEHISIEYGITTPNMHEADIKKTILKSAKQAFILADYSKFWNDSLFQIAPNEKPYRVITDWHISKEEINQFQAAGINIIVAPEPSKY